MHSRLYHALWALALSWLVSSAAGAASGTQWVEFAALKEFEGTPVQLKALVHRPEGTGPFPAIVLLHGCGGMFTTAREITSSYRYWSELLSERGFVTVLPYSFGPRGHFSICDQQKRTILESRERMEDAYAALGWLNGQPFVARGRVGLLGWSNRINLPPRYRPGVRNLNNPDKMGATVGEHPGAREDSIRRVVAFFEKNLRH
jgi:poly(3-hydroxybutyrate) depolymerase